MLWTAVCLFAMLLCLIMAVWDSLPEHKQYAIQLWLGA